MPVSNQEKAVAKLQGILSVIDTRNVRPSASLLESLRGMVTDAMDIIRERDPATRSALLAVAMLVESTEVAQAVRNGKKITRIKVTDQLAYNWAMHRIHEIAGGLS